MGDACVDRQARKGRRSQPSRQTRPAQADLLRGVLHRTHSSDRVTIMASPKSIEPKKKYFTVGEANRALPLVKVIVGDIVRQFQTVNELKQRLSAVVNEHRRPASDPYSEELAQSQADLESEESR